MFKKILITSAVLLTAATNIQATTYDFTYSNGTERAANGTKNGGDHPTNGRGYGNSFDTGNLSVTSWGTTSTGSGGGNTALNTGEIWDWQTGLGACNQGEGTVGGGCSGGSPGEHQVDNLSFDDLVLFYFDDTVSFDELVIDPFFFSDVDVTYWVGTLGSSDITGYDTIDLLSGAFGGFGAHTDIQFSGGTSTPQTLSLSGTGNALLVSGHSNIPAGGFGGSGADNDSFKIASLTTTVVPVPAAVWLFGSGLLGLVGVARRKAA
jgi:hypothetical protein